MGLFAFLASVAAMAENGVLVVHVTYLDKKPLARVRIGTVGDGSIEVTDVGGRARIRLGPRVKVGQEVELQVVPSERERDVWVFISPWNQQIQVPPFENGQPVLVVLAKKADKEALLGSSEGRKAIEQSLLSQLSKLQQAKSEITEEQRRTVLQTQAAAYGLRPEEVDAEIRAASLKSPDLYEQGLAALYEKNYPVASERLEKALVAGEKKLAEAQVEVADRAFFLGESLFHQGRYGEAVAAYKRAAELRGEDPETLNRLGVALEAAGNYSEAEKALTRGIDAPQRHNSRIVWLIRNNLAIVLQDRGDFVGAHRLAVQTVESLRLIEGANQQDTMIAMSNLANILSSQGDLGKARQLEEQVLDAHRRQLRADHPATLTAMNNLAEILRVQGELGKAQQLEEQVLDSRRRQLGEDHPDTIVAKGNLALILGSQGNLGRARQLEEQVLKSRCHQLGEDHPDTLTAMNNLAETLRSQGELGKARQLEERVLDSLRHQLGEDHPKTLGAKGNLALTLGAQGNFAKQSEMEEQVLESRRHFLGPRHSDTSLAEWNLLTTRKKLGDVSGVRELEQHLAWLLEADESQLSAQQRQIRRHLKEMQEKQGN